MAEINQQDNNIDPSQFLPRKKLLDVKMDDVVNLLKERIKLWEIRMGRELYAQEVMLLNDGIWSGIEFIGER
jgi:hypothetical protein